MKYRVVLEPQEEGGYTVYVPTLPGCVSQGETREEALANIKEAIEIYLESTGPAQLAASSLAPRLPEAGLPGSVF